MKMYRVKKEWVEVVEINDSDKMAAVDMDVKQPIEVIERLGDELNECGNLWIRYSDLENGALIQGSIDEDMLEEWENA